MRGHVEMSATAFSLERDEVGGRASAGPRLSLIKDGDTTGSLFSVAFDAIVFSRVTIIGALRGGISMYWLQRTDRYVRYLFRLYLAIKRAGGILYSVSHHALILLKCYIFDFEYLISIELI